MAEIKPEIDLGLTALCQHARSGQTLSQRDIADVCGCSGSNIYMIEKRALDKLRRIAPRHPLADYHHE